MCCRRRGNKQVRCRIRVIGHKKWSQEANHDKESNNCTTSRYLLVHRHRSPDSQQHTQEANIQWITGEVRNWDKARGVRYFLDLHRYALLSWRTRGSSTTYSISARKLAPSTANVIIRNIACIMA